MIIVATIIFLIFLAVYLVFAVAILYHLIKFRWPGDFNLLAVLIFLAGSVFFIGLAVTNFLNLPWPQI